MLVIKVSDLPQGVRDMLALEAIPKQRRPRRRIEADRYDDGAGCVLARGDKFHVAGCSTIYTFVRFVTYGRRQWIECHSDKDGWRALNVGRRYRYGDVIVPRYKVRPVKKLSPKRKAVQA